MEGERTNQTKFCSNCERDIPAGNFMLHEPHCQRHVELCIVCIKPVPKSQMDEHIQTEHMKIPCIQNMMMEDLMQVTADDDLPPLEILPLQPPRLRVMPKLKRRDAVLANALQHELNQLASPHQLIPPNIMADDQTLSRRLQEEEEQRLLERLRQYN